MTAFCLLQIAAGDAWACPLCHTGTGQAVREGIFSNGDFFLNLFGVVAPFATLALLVAWIFHSKETDS